MDANALGRWTRFAAKGGIGRCTALSDCVAEKSEDLMFLKDDEIVVLMQIPDADDLFLGYCEGVVGRFSSSDVRFHGKLKKPVMTKRASTVSSSSSAKSPTPTPSQTPNIPKSPTPGAGFLYQQQQQQHSPSPRSASFGPDIVRVTSPESSYQGSPSLTLDHPAANGPSSRNGTHSAGSPFTFREEIHDPHLSQSPSPRFASPRTSLQQRRSPTPPQPYPRTPPLAVQKKGLGISVSSPPPFSSLLPAPTSSSSSTEPTQPLSISPKYPPSTISMSSSMGSASTMELLANAPVPPPPSISLGDAPRVDTSTVYSTNTAAEGYKNVLGMKELDNDINAFEQRPNSVASSDAASVSVYSSSVRSLSPVAIPAVHPDQPLEIIVPPAQPEPISEGPRHPSPVADAQRFSTTSSEGPGLYDDRSSMTSSLDANHSHLRLVADNSFETERPISGTSVDGETGIGLTFLQGGGDDSDSDDDVRYRDDTDEDQDTTQVHVEVERKAIVDSPEPYGKPNEVEDDEDDAERESVVADEDAERESVIASFPPTPNDQQRFRESISGLSAVGGNRILNASFASTSTLSSLASRHAPNLSTSTSSSHPRSPPATSNTFASQPRSPPSTSTAFSPPPSPPHPPFASRSYASSHKSSTNSISSLTPSLRPSEHSGASEWDGASDIYDDYRYSRYSSYYPPGHRMSRFSVSSGVGGGSPGAWGANSGLGSPEDEVPPVPGLANGLAARGTSRLALVESAAEQEDETELGHGKEQQQRQDDGDDGSDSDASVYTQQSALSSGHGHVRIGAKSQQDPPTSPVRAKKRKSRPDPIPLPPATTTSTIHHNHNSLTITRSSVKSAISPLLHTAWASPEASPSETRTGTSGRFSEFSMDDEDEESDLRKRMRMGMRSGVSVDEESMKVDEEDEEDSEKDRTIEGPVHGDDDDDDDDGGLGRGIVVEDDEELPEHADVNASREQEDDSVDVTVDSVTARPDSSITPPGIAAIAPTGVHADVAPLPPPAEVAPPPPSISGVLPPGSAPMRRPTLRELRGQPEEGGGTRASLFLPHPNAPKAPSRDDPNAGPMYIRGGPQPQPQVPLPNLQTQVPPAYRPGITPPPGPPRILNAPEIMRLALQRRPSPQIAGPMLRGPTFYARADLSASMGPVPIFYSLEPLQNIPAMMMRAMSPMSPGGMPSSLSQIPPGGPSQLGPAGQPRRAMTVGPMSGTTASPPPVVLPGSVSSPLQRTASAGPPLQRVQSPQQQQPPVPAVTPPLRGDSTSTSSSTLSPSSSSGTGSNATSGLIPRSNFLPQVGGARPRSRSFSEFDRSKAEKELEQVVQRSASPSSKPIIRTSTQLEQPSAAVPIRAAPIRSSSGSSHRSPVKSTSLSNLRAPSSLSPLTNSVTVVSKGPSSPLSREFTLERSTSPLTTTAQSKPHPLRHVTSALALNGSPKSPTSPTAPSFVNVSRPVIRRADGSVVPGINTQVPPAPQSRSTLSPERDRSSSSASQGPRVSKDGRMSTESRRSQMTSPPPTTTRHTSLRTKLSLPNLGKIKSDDAMSVRSYHSPVEQQTGAMVQVKDMDFELVRPTIPNLTVRTSQDSLIRGRESLDVPQPSSFLRAESPAFSAPRSPRSPTFASTRASESDSSTVEAHRQRELRWISLMQSSPASQARKSKKVRKLLQEGVPASVRSLVWAYLTDCEAKGVPGVYMQLGNKGRKPNVWPAVERDIQRCAKESHLASVEKAMGQILQAYLTMAPDVRYDLGLTLIVGHLLLVIPEENAFWMFVSIMDTHLRPYFSPMTTQMEVDSELFGRALEINDLQLHKKLLCSIGVQPMSVCGPWFTSLFANSLPAPYLHRTWDIFLYEGPSYLIRVGLAICTLCRRQILSDSTITPEAALKFLHYPAATWLPSSIDGFLALVASFKLRDDEVNKQRVKMEQVLKKQVAAGSRANAGASAKSIIGKI